MTTTLIVLCGLAYCYGFALNQHLSTFWHLVTSVPFRLLWIIAPVTVHGGDPEWVFAGMGFAMILSYDLPRWVMGVGGGILAASYLFAVAQP